MVRVKGLKCEPLPPAALSKRLAFHRYQHPAVPRSPGMSNRSRRIFLCLALLLSPLVHLHRAAAQDGAPGYKPLAYALRNARLETGTDAAIEKGTVVVRDGIITAVGPVDQTPIPFDARVIEAEGLTVYPGFIDLYTTAGASPGAERSATGSGRQVSQSEYALAATADDYRNGITPEFQVASALTWPDGLYPGPPQAGLYQSHRRAWRRDRQRPERPGEHQRPAPPGNRRPDTYRPPHQPAIAIETGLSEVFRRPHECFLRHHGRLPELAHGNRRPPAAGV